MHKIEIIRCDIDNLNDIVELEKGFDKERYTENTIENALCSNNYINLILKYDGNVAGYLSASKCLDECELLKIIISKEYRRMGLGKRLFDGLLNILHEDNCKKIFLEVRADNNIAKCFYEKLNFEKINQRKKYYSDGVDADIYWLNIDVENLL